MKMEQPQVPKAKTWEETPETPVFQTTTEENAQIIAKTDDGFLAEMYGYIDRWFLKSEKELTEAVEKYEELKNQFGVEDSRTEEAKTTQEMAMENQKKWQEQKMWIKRASEIKWEKSKSN